MEKILNLLNQVQILVKKSNEILDSTGARFNIFRTLGVNHYENTHSAILSEFLNPKGTHSMGDEFLKVFIQLFCTDFDFNTLCARVITEKSTSEGRMDIVIESDTKAIIIENKIYAGDQWHQLQRYNSYANDNYIKGYRLLYLNLWGNEASEQSGSDVDYQPISYQYDIVKWLEECAKIAYNKPMVRETINQYINHIKNLTGMNIEKNTQNEIVQLLIKDKDSFKSAVDVVRAYENTAREEVFQTIFQDKLKGRIQSINCELLPFSPNHRNTPWYKIDVKPNSWKNYKITFEFGSKGAKNMYYGVVDSTGNESPDKIIESRLSKIFNCKRTKWWFFHLSLPKHGTWYGNEYIMMYDENSSLYNVIIEGVENIINKTKELDM